MNDKIEPSQEMRSWQSGDQITEFFVVRNIELKTKKDGGAYLVLDLGKKSGRIQGVFWGDAKKIHGDIEIGNIVKVKGLVSEYRNQLQLSVERIRKAGSDDHVDIKEFIPSTTADTEKLMNLLEQKIKSLGTQPLQDLLEYIFSDTDRAERFSHCPGGKLWHHARLGGLLEHTMSVVEICETMARLYSSIDRDLLITGAILHDIGKLDEYGTEQGFIDFTDEGRLWGHISIGAQQVRTFIEEIENDKERDVSFPHALKMHLIHLILSHQGELEHGSPVLPATLEAMVLYYADEMDSKANALLQIIDRDAEPDRKWSRFIPMLNRFLYMGDKGSDDHPLPIDDPIRKIE